MYNVVRVAVKGKPKSNSTILSTLDEINTGNFSLHFDTHSNGKTFLVDKDYMGEFLTEVRRVIGGRIRGDIIGTTECTDGTFLLILSVDTNKLVALDDQRAQDLFNSRS